MQWWWQRLCCSCFTSWIQSSNTKWLTQISVFNYVPCYVGQTALRPSSGAFTLAPPHQKRKMSLLENWALCDISDFQNLLFCSVTFVDCLQHAAENFYLRKILKVKAKIKQKSQLVTYLCRKGFVSVQLRYLWDLGYVNHIELTSLCHICLYYLAMQCWIKHDRIFSKALWLILL